MRAYLQAISGLISLCFTAFAATGYLDAAQAQALVASGRVAASSAVAPASPRSASEPKVEAGVFSQPYYQSGKKFRDCADCPEMVLVPAGSFRMGDTSDDNYYGTEPVHEVRIPQPFAVGVYEVTVDEFGQFAAESGYEPRDRCINLGGGGNLYGGWRDPGFAQGDDHPVTCMSWDDAKAYVAWLSRKTGERYRLLSESEWEYVARAGSGSKYHFGSSDEDLCRYGNALDKTRIAQIPRDHAEDAYCTDGHVFTSPVGSFSANAFGLHDVHGNVWEWTEDCYTYKGAPSDGSAWTPSGDCSERVIRGGSFEIDPTVIRSALRTRLSHDTRFSVIGFRLARTLFTP